MRRRLFWTLGLIVPAALAAVLVLRPNATDARPTGAPAPDGLRLPVKNVVLFDAQGLTCT